jgi:hypothetical protein
LNQERECRKPVRVGVKKNNEMSILNLKSIKNHWRGTSFTTLFVLTLLSTMSITSFYGCKKNNTDLPETKIILNLKKYSEDFLKLTIQIDDEFSKNPRKNIKPDFKKDLSLAKTEKDIIKSLKNAGILNSEAIITLIKSRIELENNFRVQNPDFYLLDVEKRTRLVNSQYDLVLEAPLLKQNKPAKITSSQDHFFKPAEPSIISSCASIYNTDIGRCNNSYGKCAIVAVIAAADGLIPGLVVGVFCAWDLMDCKADAREDYEYCI